MIGRYTFEYRANDSNGIPWEWCVIDKELGLFGQAILFSMSEDRARYIAEGMNRGDIDNLVWLQEDKQQRGTT